MRGWEAILLAAALLLTAAPVASSQSTSATTFDWSTRADLGDAIVELTLELPEATECSIGWAMGGSVHPQGAPMAFSTLEGPEGTISSGAIRVYPSQSIHAGPVDTRPGIDVAGQATLLPPGQWGADSTTSGPMPAGTLTYTVGGYDLHATNQDPERLGYHSLGIHIACEGAVTVTGVQVGHELLTFSSDSMSGGAGAFVSLAAGVAVADSVEHTFTSPEVHSRVSWRQYPDHAQLGTLTRTTPEGQTTYDLDAQPTHEIQDVTGPGLHRYELTRAGLDFFSSLSGVVYGIGPAGSLDNVVAG